MYKRHKAFIIVLLVATSIVSFLLELDYSSMAEASITIISIAVAVYIAATSIILGSPYAERLKSQTDFELREKTRLGVLASYLRTAGKFGIATIIVSTAYILEVDREVQSIFPKDNPMWLYLENLIFRIIGSFFCGLFFVNIVFMYLVLIFLINSMTKSVQ